MKKRGFTLIELLAVIIILAILMIISVPNILNTLNESKKETLKSSVRGYIRAVDNTLTIKELENYRVSNGTYQVMNDGNLCLEGSTDDCQNVLLIDSSGERPVEGSVTIDSSKVISTKDLKFSTSYIYISVDSNGNITTEEEKNNESESTPTVSKLCRLTTDYNNDKNLDYGDIVTCSKDSYFELFYVMPDHDLAPTNTVSLLAEKNLNLDLENPVQSDDAVSITFSPENASYWDEATTNGEFIYNENASGYQYTEAYENYLTNLGIQVSGVTIPSYNQLIELGCDGENMTCLGAPTWVYGDYWTGSFYDNATIQKLLVTVGSGPTIWNMWDNGGFNSSSEFAVQTNQVKYPLRPVVILPETEITK